MIDWVQATVVSVSIAVIVGTLLYKLIFASVIKMRGKLSVEIREQVVPDIGKSTQLLTTLSSAAIVVSFSILEIRLGKSLVMKHYLGLSWMGFVCAILAGMFASIIIYVFRATYKVMVKAAKDAKDPSCTKELIDGEATHLKEFLRTFTELVKMERYLFFAIYLQALAFSFGMVLATIFAMLNL